MTQISNSAEFQSILASEGFSKILAVNSSEDFSKSGLGWRTGQLEYVDYSSAVPVKGMTLFWTPSVDDEAKDETTHVDVVKLYGNHDLPFRVIGICSYEDTYDQATNSVLKDFATLDLAVSYALAAHQAHSFEPEAIQDHLSSQDSTTSKTSRRRVKPESDEFSP